jgi:hypothetical protein
MRKRAELILSDPETDNFASLVTEVGNKRLMIEKNIVKRIIRSNMERKERRDEKSNGKN